MTEYPTNEPVSQDRAEDMLDTWRRYQYVMFPQQRRIYGHLAGQVTGKRVLEAGCGSGQGAALLERAARPPEYGIKISDVVDEESRVPRWYFMATDVEKCNVQFCRQLYPWINFAVWDVQTGPCSYSVLYDAVVAVEMFEHLADPASGLRSMLRMLAARDSVLWLSTPNGRGKPHPPENPHHVREYTVEEMGELVEEAGGWVDAIYDWEHFRRQRPNTVADPLVYKISRE